MPGFGYGLGSKPSTPNPKFLELWWNLRPKPERREDSSETQNLKILEMARMWKKRSLTKVHGPLGL